MSTRSGVPYTGPPTTSRGGSFSGATPAAALPAGAAEALVAGVVTVAVVVAVAGGSALLAGAAELATEEPVGAFGWILGCWGTAEGFVAAGVVAGAAAVPGDCLSGIDEGPTTESSSPCASPRRTGFLIA